MPSPFGAQAMPLGQLFADPNFIHVPSYQRSFAWTREEAGRLLDDVAEALDASDAEHGGDYFLGPMLFIEPDPPTGRIAAWKAARTGRVHDVVDGLQRLTTLTILFCVLRDLDAEGSEPSSERLLAAIGTQARVRLALREPEETFFQAHVRRRGATGVQPVGGQPLAVGSADTRGARAHAPDAGGMGCRATAPARRLPARQVPHRAGLGHRHRPCAPHVHRAERHGQAARAQRHPQGVAARRRAGGGAQPGHCHLGCGAGSAREPISTACSAISAPSTAAPRRPSSQASRRSPRSSAVQRPS